MNTAALEDIGVIAALAVGGVLAYQYLSGRITAQQQTASNSTEYNALVESYGEQQYTNFVLSLFGATPAGSTSTTAVTAPVVATPLGTPTNSVVNSN